MNNEIVYYVLGFRKYKRTAVFMYKTYEDAYKRYEKENRIGYYEYVEIDSDILREEGEE